MKMLESVGSFNGKNFNEIGWQRATRGLEYIEFTKKHNLAIESEEVLRNIKEELIQCVNNALEQHQYFQNRTLISYYSEILSFIRTSL
jgi:hypothetical protein